MFFAPSLIRKIGKIVKWCAIGFALGMFTCFAASCVPAQNYQGQTVQADDSRRAGRFDVRIENQSFEDVTVYIVWEGHGPVRLARVTSTTPETAKGVLLHTRDAVFVIREMGGHEYAIGPLSVQQGMNVRLVIRNSEAQGFALPLWPRA